MRFAPESTNRVQTRNSAHEPPAPRGETMIVMQILHIDTPHDGFGPMGEIQPR